MSMPSNRNLRVLSLITMILGQPPEMKRSAPSGSRGIPGRSHGKNRVDQRKGYNKVKK